MNKAILRSQISTDHGSETDDEFGPEKGILFSMKLTDALFLLVQNYFEPIQNLLDLTRLFWTAPKVLDRTKNNFSILNLIFGTLHCAKSFGLFKTIILDWSKIVLDL